jgi:dTDP-4-dehydrorhamnose reductase
VSDLWNLDASRICGVPTKALNQKAERPLNAGLLTTKLHNQYPSLNMRGVREALEDWGVENNEITGRKGRNISE